MFGGLLPVVGEVHVGLRTRETWDSNAGWVTMRKSDLVVLSRAFDHGEILPHATRKHEFTVTVLDQLI